MPNHIYQRVKLTGETHLIMRLHNEVTNYRFCDAVIPMPIELASGEGWYNWCIEHWDTKWDVCNPSVVDMGWDDTTRISAYCDSREQYFEFTCWTAWSPPFQVWDRLMNLGVCLEAEYFDEGGQFVGTWHDGVITQWSPESDWEATCRVTDRCIGMADYFTVEKS